MRNLLGTRHSNEEILDSVQRYQEWHIEDQWARWRASHKSDGQVTTEVEGLENLILAQEQGKGAVLWGMSFCGTLFSKIALSRVGVSLTQLSSADHGAWYPLTLMGKWVAGPLKCLPEGRYLNERIRIPVDGSNRYLFRIGQVLKNNGCIWIAGERSRAKRLVATNVLGCTAQFPVGAPMMALRHKAALLPSHTERLGQFHYRLTIESPITFDRNMPRDESVRMAVDTYAKRLSAQILQHPGDFEWNDLWMQNLISNQEAE